MKKRFVFFMVLGLLALAAFVYGQPTDTTIVVDPGPSVPDWISYAVNAILAAVSVWLAKAKLRLGKAVVILQGLADALADGKITSAEITSLIKQARELIAKEK